MVRVLEWRLFSFNLEVKSSAHILERARSSTKSLSSDWCKSCGERGAFANFRNIQEIRIRDFIFGFLGKTICWIDTEIIVVHMASGLTQDHWNSKVHCFRSFSALTKSFNTSFANSVWCPSFALIIQFKSAEFDGHVHLSCFRREIPFWAYLIQRIKAVRLRWKLLPRLIRIPWTWWWCLFVLFCKRNNAFWENLVQRIKIVYLRWNLAYRLIQIS